MLELLYATGLRVTELVTLTIENMNLQQGVVRVIGKGNKERIVPMGEEAAFWVRQFVLYGRPILLNGQSSDVVFPSQRAQQMTRQTFWHRIKHYAVLAGNRYRCTFSTRSPSCLCDTFGESWCGSPCCANAPRTQRSLHHANLYSRG